MNLKIAIIQESPVYLDLAASLAKASQLITEAAQQGAKLIVFGETWLTGYPAWLDSCPNVALWDNPTVKAIFAKMWRNSLEIPSDEAFFIGRLAAKHGVTLIIGVNEKVSKGKANGTIFNALLIFDETGELVVHHRKLVPTYTERLLYGLGDGHGLKTVDTSFGRLGGLICWEHWMPLTRQAMHNAGEHIHVAVWPSVHDIHQLGSRHYAFEGRCFVIAVGQIMQVSDFPEGLVLPPEFQGKSNHLVLNGGSCVVQPNGQFLLEPQFDHRGIIFCEIPDLNQVYEERITLDVTGHYNRWDVFDFTANTKRLI